MNKHAVLQGLCGVAADALQAVLGQFWSERFGPRPGFVIVFFEHAPGDHLSYRATCSTEEFVHLMRECADDAEAKAGDATN